MRQIRQDIFLEQQQKLFMTTELRQAISVLQMSALELNEYIAKKLEENPFLDEESSSEPAYDESSERPVKRLNMDDILNHMQENNTSLNFGETREGNTFEKYFSTEYSLVEHLECQLHVEVKNQIELIIGNYLIGNIDSNGYLCTNVADTAERLGVCEGRVEKVLKIIQSFYPAGIGARNLQECLLLQLKYCGKDYLLAEKVIQEYLKEIGEKKLKKIANDLAVPVQRIQEIYDLIRTLDPKPGLQYGMDRNQLIWPDVIVMKEQGRYSVLVNDVEYSFLKVNHAYVNLFRNSDNLPEDVKKYLEEKVESALGLIRGIEQRRLNIYKVVQCIVDIQSDFLEHGIEYLKPLTMIKVAEMVNIHESTVSRVTSNKYVQTPRGLFALKYFFNSGVDSYDSDKICSKSIKHFISEMIGNEDAANPLSDQEIMEGLIEKGIKISRRTVNKYRQSMGIPTNLLRKRY